MEIPYPELGAQLFSDQIQQRLMASEVMMTLQRGLFAQHQQHHQQHHQAQAPHNVPIPTPPPVPLPFVRQHENAIPQHWIAVVSTMKFELQLADYTPQNIVPPALRDPEIPANFSTDFLTTLTPPQQRLQFWRAVQRGNADLVRSIVSAKADVATMVTESRGKLDRPWLGLLYIRQEWHIEAFAEVVEVLANAKADFSVFETVWQTPAWAAPSWEYTDRVTELLLQVKADPTMSTLRQQEVDCLRMHVFGVVAATARVNAVHEHFIHILMYVGHIAPHSLNILQLPLGSLSAFVRGTATLTRLVVLVILAFQLCSCATVLDT